MKNYNEMTVEKLENEMHDIDFDISELKQRIEDEKDYIDKSYKFISRWEEEIEGLKELRSEIEEVSHEVGRI